MVDAPADDRRRDGEADKPGRDDYPVVSALFPGRK